MSTLQVQLRLLTAILDALAILCIVSAVSKLGLTALNWVAVLQLLFSCARATIFILQDLYRAWFSRGVLHAFLLLSVALLISCVYFTLSVLQEFESDKSDEVDDVQAATLTYMAVLTLYSIVNAMLSVVQLLHRISNQRNTHVHHNASSLSGPIITLKDVTFKTVVLEDLGDKVDSSVDPSDRNVCCVCLCEMLPGEMVTELTCHHRYHTSCVKDWEVSQRQHHRPMVCPLRCDMRSAAKDQANDDGLNVVIGARG
eukprot:TRINITY_DN20090_c0_g1_i1.p1 TRINITY_DN20090_c0_g1~~TRINITY_DN20090_c0_g1_i1.p1  ORF type:complete len:256 (-),score=22.66 TRINITY_DN20090_c0_g1_i1:510-1277(-)